MAIKMFLSLIKADIYATLRNRATLLFIVLFPLVFVGVFAIGYQSSSPTVTSKPIGVINLDDGINPGVIAFWMDDSVPITINGTFFSDECINMLESLTFPDNGIKVFKVESFSADNIAEAEKMIENREIMTLVTIPANFSTSMLAAFRKTYETNVMVSNATQNWAGYPNTVFSSSVSIYGDRSLQDFSIASSILEDFLLQYTSFGISSDNVMVQINGNLDTSSLTIFDYIFPGLVVFAILLTMGTVTNIALNDVETGTLRRIRLTNVSSRMYFVALLGSHMFNAVVQIPLMFGVAMLFGFPLVLPLVNLLPFLGNGGCYIFVPLSEQILTVVVIITLLSLSICGIGFIIAGLVNDTNSGRELANIGGTPMAFLSGSFFMIPNPALFTLGTSSFGLLDIIPSTPALEALRSVLLYNRSLIDVGFDIVILLIEMCIYLIIGLFVYTRKHFAPK